MENTKDLIINLETKLTLYNTEMTLDELDTILHYEFLAFGSSGKIWYRSDYFTKNGPNLKNIEIVSFYIDFLKQDVAITRFKIHHKDKNKFSLRSSIWKNTNGQWQILFHQGTSIKNSLLFL